MADPFKNFQAQARRRGLSLHKAHTDRRAFHPHIMPHGDFVMYDSRGNRMFFEDLGEVRDELRARPVEDAAPLRRYNARIEREVFDAATERKYRLPRAVPRPPKLAIVR